MSTKTKRPKWKTPAWMLPYVGLVNNTGGNPIEEFMNDDGTNSNVFNNAPRALICVSVKSQVALLTVLHEGGFLRGIARTTEQSTELTRAASAHARALGEHYEGGAR